MSGLFPIGGQNERLDSHCIDAHQRKAFPLNQKVESAPQLLGDAGTELAANRTAMAFERTALASDRTLMAMVRTSLALIGFGFTIFSFFHTLIQKYLDLPALAPRRFGGMLIVLGIILLTLGIFNHQKETKERRLRRQTLYEQGLIHNPEIIRISATMIVALLLLCVGILAIFSIVTRLGPFEN